MTINSEASGVMQVQLNLIGSLFDLLNLSVSAEQQVDLNLTVTGITFFG